jgi:hypothetical protein
MEGELKKIWLTELEKQKKTPLNPCADRGAICFISKSEELRSCVFLDLLAHGEVSNRGSNEQR